MKVIGVPTWGEVLKCACGVVADVMWNSDGGNKFIALCEKHAVEAGVLPPFPELPGEQCD